MTYIITEKVNKSFQRLYNILNTLENNNPVTVPFKFIPGTIVDTEQICANIDLVSERLEFYGYLST